MEGEEWNSVKLVQWAGPYLRSKGNPQARLDAEMLVAHVLGTDRLGLYLKFDRPFDSNELSTLRALIKRRAAGEPLAYLLGWREFYGLKFVVTPDVLIPRPETELLVEEALRFLSTLPEAERRVLDLGTGSGCIALAIAQKCACQVWATDLSEKALHVAEQNAAVLGLESRVLFRRGSWFDALTPEDPRQFSLILSNPPYILPEERKDLDREVLQEPEGALFSGPTGMEAYDVIAKALPDYLAPKGAAYFELNDKNADKILALFGKTGRDLEVKLDLQGLKRVLVLMPGEGAE